jgi:hypothetical protein
MKSMMLFFLQLQNNIQLFHWNAVSYSAHKASDKLYQNLGPLIDKFVEVGLEKRVPAFEENIVVCHKTLTPFKSYLKKCCSTLKKLSLENDLANLRDAMLEEIHQFLYLVNLHE